MTNEELTELRAALIQLVKADERRIDAEKRIIAVLDKRLGLRPMKEVAEAITTSIAGAVGNVVTST